MLNRLSTRLGVDQQQDEVSRELGRRVAVVTLSKNCTAAYSPHESGGTTVDRRRATDAHLHRSPFSFLIVLRLATRAGTDAFYRLHFGFPG